MPGEILTLSQKELTRLEVLEKVIQKQMKQAAAAEILGLSIRQIKRLKQAYKRDGAVALLSKRRGKPSNHQLDKALKQQAIDLIQAHYPDFGPTLACEKLLERHQLKLSKESVRQLMMQAGLWRGKKRKPITVHPQRQRREAPGELVQMDGSPHAWFEGRGDPCCLLVLIDDATSKLLGLRFEPTETTQGYFRLFKTYLKASGRPLACYHDKHGIFQINAKEPVSGNGLTQFGRAMSDLGIESISANTPQAKGRVERVNKTLQDRLVKELRLQGISDIDSANAFLPQFIEQFNQKFAVVPRSTTDAHRQTLPDDATLDLIFSEQHTRKISTNLEVRYDSKIYRIQTQTQSYTMRGARLTVCEDSQGDIALLYKHKKLPYKVLAIQKKLSKPISSKEINRLVDACKPDGRSKGHKPAKNHPWRNYPNHHTQPAQASASTAI
ncbi:MAG: transposase [Gammaproteobacteria bacterium CG11_big_fil_rev_8_21_14_0_20_46_22]|nr:MAG: transposase [Gammaproteobacteria bacterium CG12_big_fil_rev_8_21_14_0_65_46_12]PIR10509.1 MAG: transposase [Gammaproteobacteria bacterium CG11_big_fil_rev_8_21_14_0_20_46_22]